MSLHWCPLTQAWLHPVLQQSFLQGGIVSSIERTLPSEEEWHNWGGFTLYCTVQYLVQPQYNNMSQMEGFLFWLKVRKSKPQEE